MNMGFRKLRRLLPSIALGLSIASLLFLTGSSTFWFSGPGIITQAAVQGLLDQGCSAPVDSSWVEKVNRIRWVTYSSPSRNPDGISQLTTGRITQDLLTLKKAGFTGLITYGSAGIMGRQFLTVAGSLGYKGVIMGIWNPLSHVELNNAANAAGLPVVLGYSIGNEGLSERPERYSIADLCGAVSGLRASTGKPVTTSEDIDTYYRRPELLWTGDWIFAISHPYWHSTKYPDAAIQWEEHQYAALAEQTDRFIFFKEVGLPSAGAHGLSETNQDLYYRGLAETRVRFAYFEAFDQPSKSYAAVEPHWGVFRADLEPKLLAWNLMGYRVFTAEKGSGNWVLGCRNSTGSDCSPIESEETLLVGRDADGRHYRSFLVFDTASLPDDAVVTSVKLKIRTAGIMGPNPLNNHQDLIVDICLPPAHTTPWMREAETVKTCVSNTAVLDETPTGGWYTADFSADAWQSINLTGDTQFRLRIDRMVNQRGKRSYVRFRGADPGGPNSPVLVVRYYIP
jgi:exo-beta-1,3-glucanase (GH17 family)